MQRSLAILACLLTLTAPLRAQVSDAIPHYQPTHRLQLPGNPHAESAAFSPDGNTLYVHINDRAVSIWEIAVYYWPEILGSLGVPLGLTCALGIRRILRRPRIPGAPHCCHCNYCLRHCASERCPECGRNNARPIRGRTTRRRILPCAIPLCVYLVLFSSMVLQVPRTGPYSKWFGWWSYDLQNAVAKHGINLVGWLRNVDRILEIDVRTGTIRRTLFTSEDLRSAWCPIVVTPDGRGLIVTIDDLDRLAVISTRSGTIRSSLSSGLTLPGGLSHWSQIAGFDPSGEAVFVVLLDEPAAKTRLIHWDLRSGKGTEVLNVGADGSDGSRWARRFFVIPGRDGGAARFLELPSDMSDSIGAAKQAKVWSIDHETPSLAIEFETRAFPRHSPGASSDGTRLYFRENSRVAAYDLNGSGGATQSLLETPKWVMPLGKIVCKVAESRIGPDPDNTTINGPSRVRLSFTEGYAIFNADSKQWATFCEVPTDGTYNEHFVSLKGDAIAAFGYLKRLSKDGTPQREILIYDLRRPPASP